MGEGKIVIGALFKSIWTLPLAGFNFSICHFGSPGFILPALTLDIAPIEREECQAG
jgi:hypothetical protein